MKKLALFPLVAMMLIGCECNESHPDAALIEESAKVGCTDFRVMTMITELRTQNGLRSDALLKSLYTKGAKFQVKNQIKQSDMSNHGNSRSYNKNNSNNQPYVFKNEWLNMHQNFIE